MSNQDNNNVFDQNPADTNTPPVNQASVDQLVGEGKKFKTVEDLVKGKLAADNHIASLERQVKEAAATIAELNTKADSSAKFDELLQKLEQNSQPNSREHTTPALGKEELTALVRDQITQQESERTAKQNLDTAQDKLISTYGAEKAKEIVAAKSRELGISLAELKELSAKSPNAFFTIMGLNGQTKSNSPNPVQNSVNSAANVQGVDDEAKLKDYYTTMRRKEPNKYFSASVQNEIYEHAKHGRMSFNN